MKSSVKPHRRNNAEGCSSSNWYDGGESVSSNEDNGYYFSEGEEVRHEESCLELTSYYVLVLKSSEEYREEGGYELD